MSPDKPATKTYSELVRKLRDHFVPKPTETTRRFKFHSRYHRTGESIADFVSELWMLAELCNFGSYLDNMLRDLLFCGVADERIQHHLLLEGTLTFEKAYSIAVSQEMASRDATVFKQAATPTGASVVGAGSDSVCLAAGVLLWRGGLSAGRLTQAIAATWVRIPATAPATFGVRSPCVDCELIVLHYSCLEFLSGRP